MNNTFRCSSAPPGPTRATAAGIVILLAGLALQGSLVAPAAANGFLEDRPFQFRNSAELSALILQEDLRQKKINDLYQPPKQKVYNNTNSTIGNYTGVTAGDNTVVDVTIDSDNSGDISTESELNGQLGQ